MTRFFAALTAMVCLVADQACADDFDFLDKSREAMWQAETMHRPAWLSDRPVALGARDKEILERSLRAGREAAPERHASKRKRDEIVICLTMSGFDLKGALEYLSAFKSRQDIRVAIAGFPKGCSNIGCTARTIHQIASKNDYPAVTLDPMVFRRYRVKVAPTMLMFRKGKLVARVEGMYNPKWLEDAVRDGQKGDLGVRGPVADIAEKNLMDVIAERVAKLKRPNRKQIMDRFWNRFRFDALPAAKDMRVKRFVPIVRARKDIRTPKGRLIVRAGQTFNLLEQMPFTRSVIVYDPTRDGERALAKRLRRDALGKGRTPILVASRLPEKSLDALAREQEKMGGRVFLLDRMLARRFGFVATVSEAHAEGDEMVVTQYPAARSAKRPQ